MNNQEKLEVLRSRAIEPLLLGDMSVWNRVAETAVEGLGGVSAALVVAASPSFHAILGQAGLGAELTEIGGLGNDFSPANTALLRNELVSLDEQGARLWGLGGWQQAARCRGLLAAPVVIDGHTVGALVVGFGHAGSPRPWQIEGALRLAHDASALLAHRSRERIRARASGLTIVDPGVARAALRGMLRRLAQGSARLSRLEEQIWHGLTRLAQRELAGVLPEALGLLRDALSSHEQALKRLDMLDEQGDSAGINLGHELMSAALHELTPARSLFALAQRFASGRMTREQTMFSLRLLGRRRSMRLVSIVYDLQAWSEDRAAMVFCSPRGEGSGEFEQGEVFFRRAAPPLRRAAG